MTGITVAQPIWVYLIAVNICTFLVYGIDKQRARSGRWRIPESPGCCFWQQWEVPWEPGWECMFFTTKQEKRNFIWVSP